MPRSIRKILPGAALVLIAVLLILKPWKTDSDTPEQHKPVDPGDQTTASEPSISRPKPEAPVKDKRASEPLDETEMEAIIDELHDLSTEYSPSAIPKIAVFFDSPHAEIRAEARESMLQLGERAAIPYLLKAAENAPTPEEAVALREGAEWLELPSSTSIGK